MNLKKWTVLPLNKEIAAKIAQEEELPFFLSMLLEVRKITTHEKIWDILGDNIRFSDPLLLTDMDKAVARIRKAIDEFERIAVYGDYDADGVTSTAMLYSYLQASGADVMFYIPDREGEGYGMNTAAVEFLHENNVKLIVTVDNGVSSKEEIARATELDMDVVVTDHHRVSGTLPKACAVVDPYREECEAPYKFFSGAGVVFKLILAMEGEDGLETVLENYADLAAIGTIGDVVPLTGENRMIVRYGLQRLAETDRPGLQALLEEASMSGKELSSSNIAFTIVPRINAVGRMGFPDRAVKLLLSEDEEEARDWAKEVCSDNELRREVENEICERVYELLRAEPERLLDRVLVIEGEGWHYGVIGIVASRITEKFGKPCIIISCKDGTAKGSGRSVNGFLLFEAISYCEDLLIRFGGHTMAAGLNILPENIPAFRKKINEYAKKTNPDMPAPTLLIDCKLKPAALSVEMARDIKTLSPFGTDHPVPVLGLFGMKLEAIQPVGGGKHLRLTLSRDVGKVQCMKFGTCEDEFPYEVGDMLDLAVTLDAQVYRGAETLSVIIRELRCSETDDEKMISEWRCFERFCRGEPVTAAQAQALSPSRNEFADLYRFLKLRDGWKFGLEVAYGKLSFDHFGRFLVAVKVLEEAGLICSTQLKGVEALEILPADGKKDLFMQPSMIKLQKYAKGG